MSYDLLVFDPATAPRERRAFLTWWDQQSEWTEDHGYDDPAVSTPGLRLWFLEIGAEFPPMNGPYAKEDFPDDEATLTDYSVGREAIYASFAWSKTELAYNTVFRLAEKHHLGFFDVSSEDGAVWLPDPAGKLTKAHEGKSDS